MLDMEGDATEQCQCVRFCASERAEPDEISFLSQRSSYKFLECMVFSKIK